MTIDELLRQLVSASQVSAIVESYAIEASDEDTLSVRVFLLDHTFINAFYNIQTGKVAFAWLGDGRRLYGKDNAKMGWHQHPFDSPSSHLLCEPVDFETFLREIEILYSKLHTSL